MASKTSYQRLKQEVIFEEDDHHQPQLQQLQKKSRKNKLLEVIKRSSSVRLRSKSWVSWLKIRKFKINFLGGFKRFFKLRRRKKLKVARLSWANKVYRRFKESQAHFGDLFAGNYLFMQVTPASLNNKNHKICVSSSAHFSDDNMYKLPSSISSSYYYDSGAAAKKYALQRVV